MELKKGDKVRIHGGAEADKYKDCIFEVLCEPWQLGHGEWVAKIKCPITSKYFPSYATEYLQPI